MSQDSANLDTSKSSGCLPAFVWLAVCPLPITSVQHLARINCFVKTEAGEAGNAGISLYLLLLAFPLFDVIVCLYFVLLSCYIYSIFSWCFFGSLTVVAHFAL